MFRHYLIEGGKRSCRVAAEAIASLDCGDDALEVSTVQQLRQLQKTMAQDEQLAKIKIREAFIDSTVWKIHCCSSSKRGENNRDNIKSKE